MKSIIKPIYLILAVLFLSGCVPTYKAIQQPELQPDNKSFKIIVPVGWVQLTNINRTTFITKEGPYLQKMVVEQVPREELFKATKIKIKKDIIVTELAEYYIAEYKKQNQRVTVTHKETLPATIDNKQGFKVIMEFSNAKGLVFDVITYGLYHQDHFYALYYQAPRLYYFNRDLPVFNAMVDSFTLTGKNP